MIKKVENVLTYAHLTEEANELEIKNRALARRIATEGIVLLENNGILPIPKEAKIVLAGVGATNTVKGGSGSGEVNERYSVSILDGLKYAGYSVLNQEELEEYRLKAIEAKKKFFQEKAKKAGFFSFKEISMANIETGYHDIEFVLNKDKKYDTELAIYVISRMSGEGGDRKLDKKDFLLSDIENEDIHYLAKTYKDVIVIINAGGMIDLSSLDDIKLSGLIFMGMLGEEGGNALADIIAGDITPSGHLTSTWPMSYKDIPYGDKFSYLDQNEKELDYSEDIYVGYRYYERFRKKVRYPFGYGLSYTGFKIATKVDLADEIKIFVKLKNFGEFKGKCVLQFYASSPEGKLKQPQFSLIGFTKSKLLVPDQETLLSVSIPYYYLASYDEESSSWVMEKGRYALYIGQSSDKRSLIAGFDLHEDIILKKHEKICPLKKSIEILTPDFPKKDLLIPDNLMLTLDPANIKPEEIKELKVEDAPENAMDEYFQEAKKIVDKLSIDELSHILVGGGQKDIVVPSPHSVIVPGAAGNTTDKLKEKNLKSFALADGPAGLRLVKTSVVLKNAKTIKYVDHGMEMFNYLPKIAKLLGYSKINKGTPLYCYTTAFPTGISLAQTWSEKLLNKLGDAIAQEMEEYGVTVWLAPGMNIHKNPLCGRNFEYFSEDPVLSGKMAKSIVLGVQAHRGCYCTLKHFACNNQENERKYTSANVSERALREIYLRGFGIAIKEGRCRGVMSSYNMINGVWSGANKDLLTKVLREEWEYKGFVITDWDESHEGLEEYRSIDSGINILMPGNNKQIANIKKALQNKTLDINIAKERALQIVQIMLLHNSIIK